MTERFQLRAGTGVRTLLIASATLSILVVSFLIYQLGQDDPVPAVRQRIAELPEVPPEDLDLSVPFTGNEEASGDGMAIGRGEKIHITLYPREGTRAKLELAVEDWKPIAGSANEFLLTKPDVRMRTQNGHAVRLTAERGTLEAERTRGGGLQPIRGTLVENVEIQYDRLTFEQRAALPEEDRGRVDPDDLILIEVDEIEFDLEYSKLIAPGPIVVTARDFHLEALDLEVRFDESSSRVDSVRMQHGGRIEFLEFDEPDVRSSRQTQFTLVEWLRSSLQAKLDEARKAEASRNAVAATAEPTFSEQGIPIFRARDARRQAPKPPVRCFGLIEGDVRMMRLADDGTQTWLEADRIEIVREIMRGGGSDSAPAAEHTSTAPGAPTAPRSRIVLEWSHQLSIDPCLEKDVRCAASASSIVALGSPVAAESAVGHASCRRMSYDLEDGTIDLSGSVETPVVIVLKGQGTITGTAVRTEEIGDRLLFHVTGPGLLEQAPTLAPAENGEKTVPPPTVRFTGELDVFARYVTRTAIDLSTGISRRRERVIDRAVFVGGVQMRDGNTRLDADRLELGFRRRGLGSKSTQNVETASARGHVVLTNGMDRITCREIDVEMRPGSAGRVLVHSATARGDVVATQGSRVVKARDRLVVDFKTNPDRTTVSVHRFRAFGDVSVRDPVQHVEIDAHELDCTIENGNEIDRALILGDKDRPASLLFKTLSVSGRRISFDAPRERADVPGAGRLSFMSDRGLDGQSVSPPVPVVVTWVDSMSYRGLENRAVFSGKVHATSQDTITYDSDELVVEFDDASPSVVPLPPVSDFPKFEAFVARILNEPPPRPVRTASRGVTERQRFGKEPTKILATGRVVALISEFDPQTGKLTSRSRIAGPKLWINLRPEVSKMQIEGAGTLLIEDLRPAEARDPAVAPTTVSLFGATEDSGPSITLIEWTDLMWYDFARNQTRFNGKVSLKHFSGSELAHILQGLPPGWAGSARGRATYLTTDALTVDFQTDKARAQRDNGRRIGGFSAGRLKQFQAFGSVVLQDEVEGLSVTADRVVFWNDRDLLGIYGNAEAKADIVMRRPGELPTQVSVERLFYNLRTGDAEVSQPFLRSR